VNRFENIVPNTGLDTDV